MRFILITLFIAACSILQGQTVHPTLKEIGKPVYMTPKAGSCGSPDGPMNSIGGPPPSYAWLQANGYCNPNAYGTNPTVCWTFTPTSSSVTINSGYSVSGCANVGFGPFTLYDNGCVVVGNGLTFNGLTPGLQYTWCMTGSAWGGGPGCTGFDDFCPYYTNNVVLPVELEWFTISCDKISWITLSEINNDYFTLYYSTNSLYWEEFLVISGNGNTNTPSLYEIDFDGPDGYYKLEQTDFNGHVEELGVKYVNCVDSRVREVETYYNTIGQEVKEYTLGIIFIKFTDGTFGRELFDNETKWRRFLSTVKKK